MSTGGQVTLGSLANVPLFWFTLVAFAEALDGAAVVVPLVFVAVGLLLALTSDEWRPFGWALAVGSIVAGVGFIALLALVPGG